MEGSSIEVYPQPRVEEALQVGTGALQGKFLFSPLELSLRRREREGGRTSERRPFFREPPSSPSLALARSWYHAR